MPITMDYFFSLISASVIFPPISKNLEMLFPKDLQNSLPSAKSCWPSFKVTPHYSQGVRRGDAEQLPFFDGRTEKVTFHWRSPSTSSGRTWKDWDPLQFSYINGFIIGDQIGSGRGFDPSTAPAGRIKARSGSTLSPRRGINSSSRPGSRRVDFQFQSGRGMDLTCPIEMIPVFDFRNRHIILFGYTP